MKLVIILPAHIVYALHQIDQGVAYLWRWTNADEEAVRHARKLSLDDNIWDRWAIGQVE